MVLLGHSGGVELRELFPSRSRWKLRRAAERASKFLQVTSRWGAEIMTVWYDQALDEAAKNDALQNLADRQDTEYEKAWSDFSRYSSNLGVSRGQHINR